MAINPRAGASCARAHENFSVRSGGAVSSDVVCLHLYVRVEGGVEEGRGNVELPWIIEHESPPFDDFPREI